MPSHDRDTVRSALFANSAFARLAARQLDDLAGRAELRTFEAGEVVCREGDAGIDAHVIASGNASVERAGAEVVTLGRGDLVGDWALFRDGRRSATVTAITPLTTVALDPRDLDDLLTAVPSVTDVVGPPARAETNRPPGRAR